MSPLSSELRNRLATTIKTARHEAETGARKALEALAVPYRDFHASMTPAERALRNRLRAHGRQLGDTLDRPRGTQEIERLAHEVAYEHWHRMLFARFLAENHLLIEPDSGVAISMAECEELAREEGEDPWTLAARFAQRMLPRIFRPDDPALQVALAPEIRQTLERLVASLPVEVFTAGDSLGWTYQFWQAEKKDEVNASGVKIGADELPARTQVFTERYMVRFLLHNTIGAWWAGKLLVNRPDLASNAKNEEELRREVRLSPLGGYDFTYLRFVREAREGDVEGQPTGSWRPAPGAFDGWPNRAAELRVLDPCCGSGHFLVESLELLVRLRMEEEALDLELALRAVLASNLFGLELDPRCTQIAAFNVAFTGWKLAARPIELPALQIACSGLAVSATKSDWIALAGDDLQLRGSMEALYDLFHEAPELGSLIDPQELKADLLRANFTAVQSLLAVALEREHANDEQAERVVTASGMARAAELLAGQYSLVITNVPYLGRGDQSDVLKAFADTRYKDARANLATIFLSRILRWLDRCGTAAVVTPQDRLFLTSYRRLREKLLVGSAWNLVVNLGPAAFRDMNWWGAKTALVMLSEGAPPEQHFLAGIDLGGHRVTGEKAALLRGDPAQHATVDGANYAGRPIVGESDGRAVDGALAVVVQADQLRNPDARIVLSPHHHGPLLSDVVRFGKGSTTGDGPRFLHAFWESEALRRGGVKWLDSPVGQAPWSGRSLVCIVPLDAPELTAQLGCRLHGKETWGRVGVAVNKMSTLKAFLYDGEVFDDNVGILAPYDPKTTPAVWAYCRSGQYRTALRRIDQALKVTAATLVKVPFNLSHWERISTEEYPDGLPEPESDDPTQWLFHGHPSGAEPTATLQVAVARLLGYRWPPEHDLEMRLGIEARAWVQRCSELDIFADAKGIVCLNPLRGETAAVDRLRDVLAAAFGAAWSLGKERQLCAAAAGDEKPVASLEEWLRDRFFEEHCRLFHHRPFIWHVWDGRRDGFHALVNYHRMAGPNGEGRRTLEALTYSYLGDWIERQKAEQREGAEGADARLAAAQDLQAQLERILVGEPPCDIFVRWKPLRQQPTGWEPNINDGVRFNIRPFLSAELRTSSRKGAGILRWKPTNIKWSKDRGKEPQKLRPKADFPWFWGCPGDGSLDERTDFGGGRAFDGNRWNDLHYTNATKRAAGERAQGNSRG